MLPFGSAGLFNIGKPVVGGTAGALLVTSTAPLQVASLADVATGSVLSSGGVGALPAFSDAPTLTTSLTTPQLYGGTGASGTLILQSTSNATRGTVNTSDLVKLATDNLSFGATNAIYVDVGTGTTAVTTGSVTALRYASTITVGAASAVTIAALFNAVAVVKDDGTARAIGPALILASQFTMTATVAGVTMVDVAGVVSAYTSIYHSPVFNRTGSGTGTVTTVVGLHVTTQAKIDTGWTCTNYDGVLIEFPGGSGTVTTFSGIRSKVTAATGRFFLNDTGGAQSLLTGPVGFGVAASTTTAAIFVAGTTAKSSLRVPHGAAPTSPVDGDIWTTSSGIFVRINGTTVGPLT